MLNMPLQVNCAVHTGVGLMASKAWAVDCTGLSMLTLRELSVSSSIFPPFLNYAFRFPFPLCLPSFPEPQPFNSLPLPLLLNASSGGFSYTGMQSSSQSQFSYSLPQGSRARTQSSDVNEALYNLDRVLQGKLAAYKHDCSGCVC